MNLTAVFSFVRRDSLQSNSEINVEQICLDSTPALNRNSFSFMLGGEYVTKQVWKNVIKKLSGIWKLKSGR
jgi:hypothetical protein